MHDKKSRQSLKLNFFRLHGNDEENETSSHFQNSDLIIALAHHTQSHDVKYKKYKYFFRLKKIICIVRPQSQSDTCEDNKNLFQS